MSIDTQFDILSMGLLALAMVVAGLAWSIYDTNKEN